MSDGDFDQTSFVNNVRTTRGGTHVGVLQRDVVRAIVDHLQHKHPSVPASAATVRRHLRLFVNATVVNPSFDSQVKDALTTRPDDFGTTCQITAADLKAIVKSSGVVDAVVNAAAMADRSRLSRQNRAATSSRKRDFINIPKLEDAVWAGTSRSSQCTLILTEGDSAKALAVAGFEVVGRER